MMQKNFFKTKNITPNIDFIYIKPIYQNLSGFRFYITQKVVFDFVPVSCNNSIVDYSSTYKYIKTIVMFKNKVWG